MNSSCPNPNSEKVDATSECQSRIQSNRTGGTVFGAENLAKF